jgi:hypothetical protein
MKGVLDSMSILKDCEAKDKLMDVVKDCFDNKEMAVSEEAELTKTLDSMWFEIHGDSLSEIAKAFDKLKKPADKPAEEAVKDSKDGEDKDKNEDSADKKDENKDSKDEEDKDKNEDSADKEDDKDKNKDGCNKDSAPLVATKDDIITAIKSELAPMVADAVKECLGLKEGKPSVEGSELDSMEKTVVRDYTSFLEK